jgi:hypothetical protein
LRDKVGAAFTASATPHGGNEQALQSILTLFMHLATVIVTPGQSEPILANAGAPYGATAVAGASADHAPTEMEQKEARALGQRVARLSTWLRLGRTVWEQNHAPFEAGEPLPAFEAARGAGARLDDIAESVAEGRRHDDAGRRYTRGEPKRSIRRANGQRWLFRTGRVAQANAFRTSRSAERVAGQGRWTAAARTR